MEAWVYLAGAALPTVGAIVVSIINRKGRRDGRGTNDANDTELRAAIERLAAAVERHAVEERGRFDVHDDRLRAIDERQVGLVRTVSRIERAVAAAAPGGDLGDPRGDGSGPRRGSGTG